MSATGPGASPAPSEPRRNTQGGAEGRHRHVHDERVHAGDALRRPARPAAVGRGGRADHPAAGGRAGPDRGPGRAVPRVTPGGAPILRGEDVAIFQELLVLIAAGRGVSPVAASVARYYARPDLAFVPIDDAPHTGVALVWRSAGETARVRAFTRAARDAVEANGGPARF